MTAAQEILSEVRSLYEKCKDLRDECALDALEYFRCNSRDVACYSDGKFSAYSLLVDLLESILDTYDDAGAGATS